MPVLKQLESAIEARAVAKIKKLGVMSRKMNGMGYRGWPDRLFILPGGKSVFIEFKRPGGTLTALQAHIHEELKAKDHVVWVCSNADAAYMIIKSEMMG